MNRKVKKVTKRRLMIFGTLSILSIIYFGYTLSSYIYTIYDLNKQKNNLQEHYVELKHEAEDLQIEINKLNDPEYLARYAREKYSYSKEGEYIIKLNDTKTDIDAVSDDINNNYIMIALSLVIILVFIYMLVKAIKK